MAKNDKQNAAENTPEKDVNQTPETPQEENGGSDSDIAEL